MIISASRRTDIPAFYTDWFMNRIRAGECGVANPVVPGRPARVSLRPEDVDLIVFWTRDPAPLLPHLDELDQRGYRYYFQYTLMNNPPAFDPGMRNLDRRLDTFRALADRIGAKKVIWRYDPIVLSDLTPPDFHRQTYADIARALKGSSSRSVISLVDLYPKVERRLRPLKEQGIRIPDADPTAIRGLLQSLADTAAVNGMEMVTCAEDLSAYEVGIKPGKCVDDRYIAKTFGIEVSTRKDPAQRKECGCVVSRDIGAYDTCVFNCVYCYATSSPEKAAANRRAHDPSQDTLGPIS